MNNNTPRNSIIDVLSKEPTQVKVAPQPVIEQEKPQKRVEAKFKDKRNGCLHQVGCGCGCRSFSCFGCFFFLILFIGIVYLFISKPPFIWSEIVNFLNDGVKRPEYALQDPILVQNSLNSQVNSLGNVTLRLTQDEVTTLLRSKIPQLTDLTTKLENNKITLFWILDNSLPAKPLFGILEITTTDNVNFKITKIGTGRIPLPEFLNSFAENSIHSLINLNSGNKDKNIKDVLTTIFSSSNISINSVKLLDKVLEVNAEIKVNLFD